MEGRLLIYKRREVVGMVAVSDILAAVAIQMLITLVLR